MNKHDIGNLTLRDHFATKALQSCMANPDLSYKSASFIADWCYTMADAMLKARGEQPEQSPHEQPQQPTVPTVPDEQPKPRKAAIGRLALSAVMLCKDGGFQEFAALLYFDRDTSQNMSPEDVAADYIRKSCMIKSRRELDESTGAAKLFSHVMANYRFWMGQRYAHGLSKTAGGA